MKSLHHFPLRSGGTKRSAIAPVQRCATALAIAVVIAATGFGQDFGEPLLLTPDFGDPDDSLLIDVDGDLDLDIISAEASKDTIWIVERYARGWFRIARPLISTADSPVSLCAADLDGDGIDDLVSASVGDSKIAWYAGDGAGGFGPESVISTTAGGVTDVAAADLDGDGDMELIYTVPQNSSIVQHENLGGGQFGAAVSLFSSAPDGRALTPADLDGDGDTDVAFADPSTNQVWWLENFAGTAFAAQEITSVIISPDDIDLADLDDDGDLDLAIASRFVGLVVLEQVHAASFGPPTIIAAGSCDLVTSFDFTGNGLTDLVTSGGGTALVERTGPLQFEPDVNIGPGGETLLSGDITGDGRVDLLVSRTALINEPTGGTSPRGVVANFPPGPSFFLVNNGAHRIAAFPTFGSFCDKAGGYSYPTGGLAFGDSERVLPAVGFGNPGWSRVEARAIDYNADGLVDFSVTGYADCSFSRSALSLNAGDGTWLTGTACWGDLFPARPPVPLTRTTSGLRDMVGVNGSGDIRAYDVLLSPTACTVVTLGSTDGREPISVDLDVDGLDDLVFASCAGIEVWRNQAGGFFAPPSTLDTRCFNSGLALDVDQDGFPDVVGAGNSAGLVWFPNSGSSFSSAIQISAIPVERVVSGDIDRDGLVDLVVAEASGSVLWFKNLGGGAFDSPRVVSDSLSGIGDIQVGDVNLDQLPEVLIQADGGWRLVSSLLADCDANGVRDANDIASGAVQDCDDNGIPDQCDIASGFAQDCNANGVPDFCDLLQGVEADCNGNGILDSCEVAAGTAFDCNGNGVLDSCEIA
ncbi:VCBS repeat-containing protein, partial [Planctomycetota bacterium]|nr:VCBS repeat-containing protein [Planctomycetota bacterium]